MRDLAIVDWFGYNMRPQERMRLIKEAGFAGVLLLWTDQFDSDFKSFPKYADEAGLYVESAHAPYLDADTLWVDNIAGQDYSEKMLACIKDCAAYSVKTLVMHPTNTKIPLPENNVGINRLKRMVESAQRYSVNLAVENTVQPAYLEYIFNRISSDRLGFCFDSGHSNLYCAQQNLLALYGDRLMALHLHDNDGQADQHALPRSGSIDWAAFMAQIKAAAYQGAIALETRRSTGADIDNPEEFLAYAAATMAALWQDSMSVC